VQTSLLFSSTTGKTGSLVRPESRVYIIASPNPREGRTTTIANLAVIAAEAGLRVLLVDADLRKPDIHKIFGLQNQSGLATLLAQTAAEPEMLNGSNGSEGRFLEVFNEYVQATKLSNLKIMSSGLNGTELRSTQLLGFDNLRRCVEIIQNSGQFDVILFDTAPTSTTADSYVLAATTQANVILLAEAKRTNRTSAIKTREQFTHLNANLSGVILNKL
jgi:capsular exopolysaccharide synthesis family protein